MAAMSPFRNWRFGETEQACILRVYNNPLCDQVDNYNASAYYEPSCYLAESFEKGEF